jgi:hypothetical protein
MAFVLDCNSILRATPTNEELSRFGRRKTIGLQSYHDLDIRPWPANLMLDNVVSATIAGARNMSGASRYAHSDDNLLIESRPFRPDHGFGHHGRDLAVRSRLAHQSYLPISVAVALNTGAVVSVQYFEAGAELELPIPGSWQI